MIDDLLAFLRARLDEEAALAGGGETWTAFDEAPDTGTRRVDVDHSFERVTACTRSWRARHIAGHDPARVLREVEAKLRILEIHRPYVSEPDQACLGCAGGIQFQYCPIVRLLALPYAGHPDYREEWRP